MINLTGLFRLANFSPVAFPYLCSIFPHSLSCERFDFIFVGWSCSAVVFGVGILGRGTVLSEVRGLREQKKGNNYWNCWWRETSDWLNSHISLGHFLCCLMSWSRTQSGEQQKCVPNIPITYLHLFPLQTSQIQIFFKLYWPKLW